VASSADVCEPSWGTYYAMDEAQAWLDLDRRIARRDQRGGDVVVSFGGQLNDAPLAVWLTVPVAPAGLTPEGTDAVTQLPAAALDLAGVNLMTMDYGCTRCTSARAPSWVRRNSAPWRKLTATEIRRLLGEEPAATVG
jgi:chitinase